MSDQKNTTETPNIDDYLLNIDTEGSNAPSQTMEQGLDMDFLNQLGGDSPDISTQPDNANQDTALDEFDLDSLELDKPDEPMSSDDFLNNSSAPTNEPMADFLATSPQNSDTDTEAVAVAGATGLGVALAKTASAATNTQNTTDDTKKSKGFFSGRFGKKEKSAPQPAPTDSSENLTETLLANKAPKKGLFSRLNKKEPTTKAEAPKTAPTKESTKTFGGFGKKADAANTQRPSRASKTPKTTPPKKTATPDAKKKQQLLLGALLCLVLLAVVAYLFLNNNTPEPAPIATPDPAPAQVEPTPDEQTQSILPENNIPAVNPDEILNAEIPSDPALVKEEIDRLNDTGARLDEQGKIIEEQLTLMEDLTTAKAEQIALLEKQIAELEKQKASVGTPAPEQPATAPQPQPQPQQ